MAQNESARKYNASHLSSTKNYQVQETNWFEVKIGNVADDLTFLTQSCTLPESSNPAIDVGFGNSTAKVAGKREYGEGTIVFMDAMVVDVEKQILAWQKQVYDPKTGKMGWVSDYKRDVFITQYGPDGTYERQWHLEGAWPSAVSYGEMNGESADKKVISVTLTYDNAYRDDLDY